MLQSAFTMSCNLQEQGHQPRDKATSSSFSCCTLMHCFLKNTRTMSNARFCCSCILVRQRGAPWEGAPVPRGSCGGCRTLVPGGCNFQPRIDVASRLFSKQIAKLSVCTIANSTHPRPFISYTRVFLPEVSWSAHLELVTNSEPGFWPLS